MQKQLMFGYRQKLFRASYFLLGGMLILILWSLVAGDVRAIVFDPDHVEQIPGDTLELLFYHYLITALGLGFCLIGIAGFLIIAWKFWSDKVY